MAKKKTIKKTIKKPVKKKGWTKKEIQGLFIIALILVVAAIFSRMLLWLGIIVILIAAYMWYKKK